MISPEDKIPRFAIGKVRISAVTMTETLRLIDERINLGRSAYICVANVRTTVLSQTDKPYCEIQNGSFLTVPDGMPLVWFAKLAKVKNVERVVGADLMTKMLELSKEKGYSHYFLGDTESTLAKMTQIIANRYPGTIIKASFSPPFRELTDGEISNIAQEINCLKPTFVWIALGAPKQERFMARIVGQLDKSILLGVGAAFRFVIGEYKHPPKLLQMCGLEGFCWRFLSNPIGEACWYCYHIPVFGYFLLTAMIKRIKGA